MVFKYSIFLLCLLPMSVFGEINKCLINGAMVYTSKRCPDNTLQKFEMVERSANIIGSVYRSSKWYNDYTGYKKALEISLAKKAPLFIYGRTDWCPYCKKFDNTFLSDRDVQKVLSGFVKVKLNPEHSREDEKLFKSWGGRGYPSLFVQSGQESVPKKIKIPFIKRDDKWEMISNEAFISILQEQAKNY